MKLALFALASITAGMIASQSTASALPGPPCDGTQGYYFTRTTYFNEDRNAWVLQEFVCTHNDSGKWHWVPTGYPLYQFLSEDEPDGWTHTPGFQSNGAPNVRAVGGSDIAEPPAHTSYWNSQTSRAIQRKLSAYVYAADICNALWSGDVTGERISPSHVYRVDNDWHYIPDADDRDAFDRPDATMQSIWGQRVEYRDPDNNPATQNPGMVVTNIAACNR